MDILAAASLSRPLRALNAPGTLRGREDLRTGGLEAGEGSSVHRSSAGKKSGSDALSLLVGLRAYFDGVENDVTEGLGGSGGWGSGKRFEVVGSASQLAGGGRGAVALPELEIEPVVDVAYRCLDFASLKIVDLQDYRLHALWHASLRRLADELAEYVCRGKAPVREEGGGLKGFWMEDVKFNPVGIFHSLPTVVFTLCLKSLGSDQANASAGGRRIRGKNKEKSSRVRIRILPCFEPTAANLDAEAEIEGKAEAVTEADTAVETESEGENERGKKGGRGKKPGKRRRDNKVGTRKHAKLEATMEARLESKMVVQDYTRFRHLIIKRLHVDKANLQSSAGTKAATPFYNASLLALTSVKELTECLASVVAETPKAMDVLRLLKIVTRTKKFPISGFHLLALTAHFCRAKCRVLDSSVVTSRFLGLFAAYYAKSPLPFCAKFGASSTKSAGDINRLPPQLLYTLPQTAHEHNLLFDLPALSWISFQHFLASLSASQDSPLSLSLDLRIASMLEDETFVRCEFDLALRPLQALTPFETANNEAFEASFGACETSREALQTLYESNANGEGLPLPLHFSAETAHLLDAAFGGLGIIRQKQLDLADPARPQILLRLDSDNLKLARPYVLGPVLDDAAAAATFREIWGEKAQVHSLEGGRVILAVKWDVPTPFLMAPINEGDAAFAPVPASVVETAVGTGARNIPIQSSPFTQALRFLSDNAMERIVAGGCEIDAGLRLADAPTLDQYERETLSRLRNLESEIERVKGVGSVALVSPVGRGMNCAYFTSRGSVADLLVTVEHWVKGAELHGEAGMQSHLALTALLAVENHLRVSGGYQTAIQRPDMILEVSLSSPPIDLREKSEGPAKGLSSSASGGAPILCRIRFSVVEAQPEASWLTNPELVAAGDEPCEIDDWRVFHFLPRLGSFIDGHAQKYSSLAGATRLVKFWWGTNCLTGRACEDLIELLCLYSYLEADGLVTYGSNATDAARALGTAPTTVNSGFFATMHLLTRCLTAVLEGEGGQGEGSHGGPRAPPPLVFPGVDQRRLEMSLRALPSDPALPQQWFRLSLPFDVRGLFVDGPACAHEAKKIRSCAQEMLGKVARAFFNSDSNHSLVEDLMCGRARFLTSSISTSYKEVQLSSVKVLEKSCWKSTQVSALKNYVPIHSIASSPESLQALSPLARAHLDLLRTQIPSHFPSIVAQSFKRLQRHASERMEEGGSKNARHGMIYNPFEYPLPSRVYLPTGKKGTEEEIMRLLRITFMADTTDHII